jgi:site-specific DNA-cytosine methylase
MILELFPCSGGMAAGLRAAGLMPDVAFDYSADACSSYERNLGHRPIQIDVNDLVRLVRAGWSPGARLELLVADPPCTPWSRAGKRLGQADERDMLAVTVEIVRLLRPTFWLIANVPGLDDGPNLPVVQRTIGSLARPVSGHPGWCIDVARLDAADYGVPQHRVRPFWFGHPTEEACVVWPARTHGSPAECRNGTLPGVAALRPWVTCREALGHLSAEDLGSPVRLRWRGQNGSKVASTPDEPARVVGTSSLFDGNVLAPPDEAVRKDRVQDGRKPRASDLDEPSHVVTCRDSSGDGSTLLLGPNYPPSANRALTWPWEVPVTTIQRGDRIAPPGHHGGSFLSHPNAVKLSEKAAAILQGFPEDWYFAGATKTARWAQIGMAMPPPLAEAVARSLARAMGCHANRQERSLFPLRQ